MNLIKKGESNPYMDCSCCCKKAEELVEFGMDSYGVYICRPCAEEILLCFSPEQK